MPPKQTVMFRTVNGNVTVNEVLRKPEQSKDIVKPVRLQPQDADELKDICFEKNTNFSEFTRDALDLLKVYYDHRETLLANTDIFILMAERLSKKF